MMQYSTTRILGRDRLAEVHRQAQRDALTRATWRQHSAHQASALLATLIRAHRREAATGNAGRPLMPPAICRPR
jgi:hypothetical protein